MCVRGMDRFNCMRFFVFFILFIKFKRISLSCHLAIKYLLLICIVMTLIYLFVPIYLIQFTFLTRSPLILICHVLGDYPSEPKS